jgi:hypothetical protein
LDLTNEKESGSAEVAEGKGTGSVPEGILPDEDMKIVQDEIPKEDLKIRETK